MRTIRVMRDFLSLDAASEESMKPRKKEATLGRLLPPFLMNLQLRKKNVLGCIDIIL